MNHELKCIAPYFDDVVSHGKRFEIRVDDRNFRTGDTVLLREFVPCSVRCSEGILGQDDSHYTGREWSGKITYVIRESDGAPGLLSGYCVFGIDDGQSDKKIKQLRRAVRGHPCQCCDIGDFRAECTCHEKKI